MKKTIVFFFLLFFSLFAYAQSSKVLFIGNSYTYVNNLPDLISMMLSSSGDDFDYQMSTPGGCTFQQHCTVSSSYIQQTGWDYGIPGNGLLIYHVDYEKDSWGNNKVNISDMHYRYDLFHADEFAIHDDGGGQSCVGIACWSGMALHKGSSS